MKRREFLKSVLGFALAVPTVKAIEAKPFPQELIVIHMRYGFLSRNEMRAMHGLKPVAFADAPIKQSTVGG